MADSIFYGMQILIDHAWHSNQAVIVEGDKIKAIIPENMMEHHMPAQKYRFPATHHLIPGLIDLHIHGAKGMDVMDATPEALQGLTATLAREGVTNCLATTMTAAPERIEAALKNAAAFMQQEHSGILGVHLEGPFISAEKIGAQNIQFVRDPDIRLFRDWQQIAKGAIKIVTLAPELKGAIEFINQLTFMGVVAAMGHTNATFEQTQTAIDAGARYATHLYNAMRMFTQRELGAAGAMLLDDRITAELILDHMHLHRGIVELTLRVKKAENIILVTDAIRAKCLGNGDYELGGLTVTVREGKACLADGRLAGSTLKLSQAIKNMAAFKHAGLIEAIAMATHNPASVIGCADRKGTIEVGKDADLVVLNSELDPVLTMRGGKEIFRNEGF